MVTATIESGIWDVDAKTYHADSTAISHSALEKFRISPLLYHQLYVAKTLPFDPPTPSMLLGTALHALLLEPEKFGELVAVAPNVDGRTKEGKAAKERFAEISAGKAIITTEQMATVQGMADGVQRNCMAADLLSAVGRSELSIRWTDESTRLECKARFDRVLDCGVAVDVKTTIDPRPPQWSRQAASLGYHKSAAHYLEGWRRAGDRSGPLEYLHLLVGSQPPYESAIVCFDAAALDMGRRENVETLLRLAECFERDDWSGPWSGQVNHVGLPKYYKGD